MIKKNRFIFFLIFIGIVVLGAVWLMTSRGHRPEAVSPPAASAFISGQDAFFIDLAVSPAQTPLEKDSLIKAMRAAVAGTKPQAALKIDYPLPDSIFPSDMVAPTFVFHDSEGGAKAWFVDISIAGEAGHLYVLTDGRRAKKEIDPLCASPNNVYQEPAYQAAAKEWKASAELWNRLTPHSEKEMTATFYGLADPGWDKLREGISFLSQGNVTFRISRDRVGAPIFYRDVPLMPNVTEKGVIMPLADDLLPLIGWRLRDLSKSASTLVLKDMPTCANCHSFSSDGKFLGMDIDLPKGDKGGYTLVPVRPKMVIQKKQLFSWASYNPQWLTYGLFSRVSPDGRYVISSVNENAFITNYMDFRFLQTFYPTRGILAFYDRRTEKVTPLPGADNPEYVHTNAVWTPDGRALVFIRAKAINNVPQGKWPLRADDPNEIQIKYDLYTVPFNDGRGGEARPLAGASDNGKSNSFPKVSPDGRWIVWVQAANGLLMRPDSELSIMPLSGGRPRRMTCNLPLMNSWHSWSPNSRWLVFSSKANTPFTQMFLTHIDEQGNDSPAVLIPDSTAANRAVNIPEFVNIKPEDLVSIDIPAVDYRRHLNRALELIEKKDLDGAYKELLTADEMKPGYRGTLTTLGYYFREKGDFARAAEYFEKALALDPRYWPAHNYYGVMLFRQGKYEEALRHFQAALETNSFNPQVLTNIGAVAFTVGNLEMAKKYFEAAIQYDSRLAKAHSSLALILEQEGKFRDAAAQYEKCLEIAPDDAGTCASLAWLLATCPDDGLRNGRRALELAQKFERLSGGANPQIYDILAAAYAETGQFSPAVQMAEKALQLTKNEDPNLGIRGRLVDLYKSGKAYHRQGF